MLRSRRSGLTLIESLITVMVIGVMLLLVSRMVRDMQMETIHSQDNDRRLSAHQTLDRIGQALRSCKAVLEPAAGATSNVLRLSSYNPGTDNARLAPAAAWSPDNSAYMMERRFAADAAGDLLCTHTFGTGNETVFLFANVTSFQVRALPDRRYELTLSWKSTVGRPQTMTRLSRDSWLP
jgi:prepilin-type N-terminal cleavage/methylation domain-containing protein